MKLPLLNLLSILKSRNFIILLLIATLSRLLFLGIYPPGNSTSFWFRLPSALSGILSIMFLYGIVIKRSKNSRLAWLCAFSLTIMPWHIEQSRIHSEAMCAVALVLGSYLLLQLVKSIRVQIGILILTAFLFYALYPSYWVFHSPFVLPPLFKYLNNVSRLVSVEFLFYTNDSFWIGGMRRIGVVLPSFLPFLLIGLFQIAKHISWKKYLYVGVSMFVVLLAAAGAPYFPEGREYFLITPLIAIILGIGIDTIIRTFYSQPFVIKGLMVCFLFFMAYEQILFYHFYISHYSQRIQLEIPFSQRNF